MLTPIFSSFANPLDIKRNLNNTGVVRSIHRPVSVASEGKHQVRRHSRHAALPQCEYVGACNPIMIVVNTYCCILNFNQEHIAFLWT